jgi:tetratricopeptide (TPR) repeat protein
MAIQGYREVINQIDQRTQWDTKATILNDYAVILLELERYHEALDLQLIVLELWMDNDPSRSEVAIIHNNIAQTYHGIEEFELAEENYLTSLTMLMEFFPDGNHPDISSTLNNLGVLLRDQGNYEEAIRYYREALDIRRATLGESHPNTAFSHLNLSRMLLELDRVEEARPHSQIAVDIMSEALNDTHLHLLVARSTLARIYTKDGRYVEAESILSDVVAIMDKEFVPAWIIEQAQQWLTEARELNPD